MPQAVTPYEVALGGKAMAIRAQLAIDKEFTAMDDKRP
jgi:hypothetical protein